MMRVKIYSIIIGNIACIHTLLMSVRYIAISNFDILFVMRKRSYLM